MTRRESELYDAFRTRLVKLTSRAPPGHCSSWWRKRCADLANDVLVRPLEDFLRWSDVVDMYEIPMFIVWYQALRASKDWDSRWVRLTRKSPHGNAHPFAADEGSAPVPTQHAYHLMSFEKLTGTKFTDVDMIIEVGGGYGNFCRMLRVDGFRGPHVIIDLPHIREIQRLFLGLNDVPTHEAVSMEDGAHLVVEDDIAKIIALAQGRKVGFLATWSLSETPLAFREKIFPSLHANVDRYLVAIQDYVWPSVYGRVPSVVDGDLETEGVDNTRYFEGFMRDAERLGTRWITSPVPCFETQRYLFGTK